MGDQTLKHTSALLSALNNKVQAIPPIWLMRQAGRYLPEYRALRAKAGSFLDLCNNPDLAAEATLQPIRRFDFDAAILFADILLLPFALGQNLSFAEGEGPHLDPPVAPTHLDVFRKRNIHERLQPVYETVARVRKELAPEKALIGFAGAPWTVATYMLTGGPHKDPAALRKHWYDEQEFVSALIDILVDTTVEYLSRQIESGADAVQLFDTWAGGLPEDVLRAVSIEPLARIGDRLKAAHPETPVIFFPKGAGAMAEDYARLSCCDGLSIDFSTPWSIARRTLSPHTTVQGGLDPMLVVKGGRDLETGARGLCETFRGVPFIFNLGHGLTPDTPPEHVARLVEIVRDAE
ncbi:MAG: uroporphyrinogen decarboxylase [Pseudomonadota bacterium]